MDKKLCLRWAEEAEARQVREFAMVQHAAAEVGIAIAAAPDPTGLRQRLHGLAARLRWSPSPRMSRKRV
jgi:hypothetical protein